VRSTAAPYTESRLTRSVANERVGFPVVEQSVFRIRIGDPVLCCAFLTTGSGIEKYPDPGSEMSITDHISESLVTIFWIKNIKVLDPV
jgi:hypothetical protein